MTDMSPMPKDDPVMIAWDAYVQTPDYENSERWATEPEHTRGSLWAAFLAGFRAARTGDDR